jgi:hypothetical protein
MRKIILLAGILSVIASSCTKSSSNSGNSQPPPPPPGGGSGSTAGITITSIFPLNPYPGDVITIQGTGFDPDKTKDTVTMGFTINNLFGRNGQGGFGEFISPFTTKIISATATEIKFTNDSALVINTGKGEVPIAFQVKSPGKTCFTGDTLSFKDNLSFYFSYSDPQGAAFCYAATFAGDSLYFSGKGLYPPVSVTAFGKSIQLNGLTKADIHGEETATGYLPINFFSGIPPDPLACPASQDEVTMVNGDGRKYTYHHYFFQGPNSLILGALLDQLAYYKSAGKNPILTVKGYALRPDYTLRITGVLGNSTGSFSEEIAFPIGGYPGVATQEIDLGALPTPAGGIADGYNIELKIGSGPYGGPIAGFSLFK